MLVRGAVFLSSLRVKNLPQEEINQRTYCAHAEPVDTDSSVGRPGWGGRWVEGRKRERMGDVCSTVSSKKIKLKKKNPAPGGL